MSLFKRLTGHLLDALYPPTCVHCSADGAWLCGQCMERIEMNAHGRCRVSGGFRAKDHECDGSTPFASVTTLGSYAQPELRALITGLKYSSAHCLVPSIEAVLKSFRFSFLDPWPWAGLDALTVTSVPPDDRRLRERGIDHAALIADAVQRVLVPWGKRSPLLARVRSSYSNAGLPVGPERVQNVAGLFTAQHAIDGAILLVDDVFTTGATARSAGQTLVDAGAKEVHIFTLAQGG